VKAKGIVTLAGASRAGSPRAVAIHLTGPVGQACRQVGDNVPFVKQSAAHAHTLSFDLEVQSMARSKHVEGQPRLLSPDEAVRMIGHKTKNPKSFLFNLRRKGLLKGVRLSNAFYYPECEVLKLLRGEVGAAQS